jgi:hypothetical protein
MRKIILAAAMAMGLVMLWAAILPLTAQPAPAQTIAGSPAMAKALFLCRGPNGIDRACAAALAQAVVLDGADGQVTRASDRHCRVDRQVFASLERHD